ncbi:hypothetical protein P7K49_001506 [Saguinus oedipus]|uniref:Uncharacterized protein n=1 Tax=Saguinus oedipus TaxID=9490 RepID=A0ABQ9WFA4_SAGOE|nr:hypothetical protein P7K49_001506 [Saguinus oedipus]
MRKEAEDGWASEDIRLSSPAFNRNFQAYEGKRAINKTHIKVGVRIVVGGVIGAEGVWCIEAAEMHQDPCSLPPGTESNHASSLLRTEEGAVRPQATKGRGEIGAHSQAPALFVVPEVR